MLRVILTLDYEIHGNGEGCPRELMVEPTDRLLQLCQEYGAQLTIMADVAEILKFKEYKEAHKRDDYSYDAIVEQLRRAIKNGHDVQLHIHSSYFGATHGNGSWIQNWEEYDFASLPYERINWMVRSCKEFLEALLRPIDPAYRCIAFRAANWSVSPSTNVVRGLINNGITIDTSIFKYGRRSDTVQFDYSEAYSAIQPWRVRSDDIRGRDESGSLWELPIYSEHRWIGAFISSNRVRRTLMSVRHALPHNVCEKRRVGAQPGRGKWLAAAAPSAHREGWLGLLTQKHAWKADFNQCGGRQLINALHRASRKYDRKRQAILPFILIGHPKLFTKRNERGLASFLSHCAQNMDAFRFDTLRGVTQFAKEWDTLERCE